MFMNPFQQISRMLFHKNILFTNADTTTQPLWRGMELNSIFLSRFFFWRSESEMLTENASHKWSTASSFIMNCENTFFCCYDTGSCERGKKDFYFQFHSVLLLLQFSEKELLEWSVYCFPSFVEHFEKRRQGSTFNAFSRSFEGRRCLCFGILERVIYSWTLWHCSRAPE